LEQQTNQDTEQQVSELLLVQELESRLLRLQADMENMRRRHQREKDDLWEVVVADIVCQLLPTMDSFDRAVKVLPPGDWTQGMVMVHKQLQEFFTRLGLESVDCTCAFDPQCHEAVAIDEDASFPENTITAELERGYRLRGRVLRPSKVRVTVGGKNNE